MFKMISSSSQSPGPQKSFGVCAAKTKAQNEAQQNGSAEALQSLLLNLMPQEWSLLPLETAATNAESLLIRLMLCRLRCFVSVVSAAESGVVWLGEAQNRCPLSIWQGSRGKRILSSDSVVEGELWCHSGGVRCWLDKKNDKYPLCSWCSNLTAYKNHLR